MPLIKRKSSQRDQTGTGCWYEETTYYNPHWIIRFPHERRFRAAVDEIVAASPTRFIDYGAGDCHLMVLLAEAGVLPETSIAYEPLEEARGNALEMLEKNGLEDRVQLVSDLAECEGTIFDCVACMEVLEHMPIGRRERFYRFCDTSLRPGGIGIVDVPVEFGPAWLVKELARVTLKGQTSDYTLREVAPRVAGVRYRDPRRFDRDHELEWIHTHGKFDYREIIAEIEQGFEIKRVYPTPFPRLPARLANQEVFIIFEKPGTSVEHEPTT